MIEHARANHILRTLRPLGPIKAEIQMGRVVLFSLKGRVLGLLKEGNLYIKIDPHTEGAFDRAGCEPFRSPYTFRYPATDIPFRRLPRNAQECSRSILDWARLGVEAIRRETVPV